MGAVWTHDLPSVLRAAGLRVDTYPGWEVRSRSSGGYEAIRGVCVHHTAGSGLYPDSDMQYMWRNSSIAPIGAIYLARDGKLTVGAAGATNTQGKGGPLQTSKGQVPLNDGNRWLLAIEAANRGDGTPWPVAQQDAYVKAVAAICKRYGLNPKTDVYAHHEYAPSRKIDPAGTSRYADGRNKWNMNRFRSDVVAVSSPPPKPPPPDPGDDMTAEQFNKMMAVLNEIKKQVTSANNRIGHYVNNQVPGTFPDLRTMNKRIGHLVNNQMPAAFAQAEEMAEDLDAIADEVTGAD